MSVNQAWVDELRETGSFVIPADYDMEFGELWDTCRAAGVGGTVIRPEADDGTIRVDVTDSGKRGPKVSDL